MDTFRREETAPDATGHPLTRAIDVLWRAPRLDSIEHFSYRQGPDTHVLRGTVLLPRNTQPTTIHYQVHCDTNWVVRSCRHRVIELDGETLMEIEADGGRWWIDGQERHDLAGCNDVDLGWTPATNTLPIRRSGLGVGERIAIRAAWVTFPDLVVRPAVQRYERTGEVTWKYRSGDFAAELITDELGFVVTYGHDLWFTAASSRTND